MSQTAAATGTGHSGPGLWARLRRDKPWWLLPVTVVVVLGGFSVYGTWTAVAGGLSDCSTANTIPGSPACGPYLSPFWSPRVPWGGPFPAAVYILPIPLLFRATCYYYRKAYYRSFFWDPPACAIGELRHHTYHGEHRLPLSLTNLHRFAMYAVTVVLVFLWIDAFEAFHYNGTWWIGVGSVVMLVNVILLTGYSASCHSLRHLVGGGLDCFSAHRFGSLRHRLWARVSHLNENHPTYAWLSLFSVVITDVYIRLLQHGVFADPHITF
jgi:hypothetical protein